jgi:hypothetical protein
MFIIVIQAPFIPSDYGRLCECTTGYTAQGDNQLTIVVGERVILLKCGTRGWALCRSEDGTKFAVLDTQSPFFPIYYNKPIQNLFFLYFVSIFIFMYFRHGWFPAKYLRLMEAD